MGKESNLSVLWSFKVISQGAISAPMFSLKGPSMVKAAYPTAFPLKHQQKVATICLSMHSAVTNSLHMAWSDPDWLPDDNQTNKSWQDLRLALALAESVSQSIPTQQPTSCTRLRNRLASLTMTSRRLSKRSKPKCRARSSSSLLSSAANCHWGIISSLQVVTDDEVETWGILQERYTRFFSLLYIHWTIFYICKIKNFNLWQ